MIKKFLFILLVMMPIFIHAQITIGNRIQDSKPEMELKYDSLSNISEKNILSLKGQTLFVMGNAFSKENGFHFLFYNQKGFHSDAYKKTLYKQSTRSSKGYEEKFTPYEAVAGKYYIISDIYSQKHDIMGMEYCLLLNDINASDSLYCYLHNLDSSIASGIDNLLILGYYEKLKQLNVGKSFRVSKDNEFEQTDNGKIKLKSGSVFKCKDVAVNLGEYNNLYLILGDKSNIEIKASVLNNGKVWGMIDNDRYHYLTKKFGIENANLIIAEKVRIGMSKQAAKESWGEPNDINTTTGSYGTHEQWVYGDGNYLYFENGKLTDIQN